MTSRPSSAAGQSSASIQKLAVQSALLDDGWRDQVVISIASGRIESIEDDRGQSVDHRIEGVALPGMANVHSHAFQRSFAGLTEYQTAQQDSFWTWRQRMYQFLEQLTPDDVYLIARQLYLEMLLGGYCWVGEFHYLHHQPGGQRYNNLTEMSDAIERAAQDAGIGLCHLPVLYQRGGFDGRKLDEGQLRFELKDDEFLDLVHRLQVVAGPNPHCRVGAAFHSLRAVEVETIGSMTRSLKAMDPSLPIHIHISEQTEEVRACLQHHDQRPVELLTDQVDVDSSWCLVHATHLEPREINRIAQSGAVVGLCPTTEANLGDGIFPAEAFQASGGRLAIGSDSHCSLDVRDELRTIEYGQRLSLNRRAILCDTTASVGRHLYQSTAQAGAAALGIPGGTIAVGKLADLTLVDPQHHAIAGAAGDRLLDRLIFVNIGNPILGCVVGGTLHLSNSESLQARLRNSTREFISLSQRLRQNR